YKNRSSSPAIELLKYIFFYPLVCLTYFRRAKKYDIVHHMFPTSVQTIDPLLMLIRIFSAKTKIIIGPLQLLSDLGSKQDLSVMLVGKQDNSLLTALLPAVYQFLIMVTAPLAKLTFQMTDIIVCN